MVRGRLPKRPPTPSESDDETEESELMLPVGAEAEVRSDDPGFVGSFYEVTVNAHLASRGRYKVVYSTLVAEDGGPLEETAAAADVRPRPPREGRREFAVHEAVEALHNDGWWAGVVSGAPRVYEVTFPTSRETMEFEETAMRRRRVFQAGRWVPAADVEDGSPLFPEGIQVEVSQSAKIFGESWSPASVLKVIGATSLLVQYTHVGQGRELATEIIDSQYIRPARTDTLIDKYKLSQSSHVEVMHEGSWWPGVIQEVLGSQYAVKIESYETDMDDVECVDVLIVGITQLRPHFDWAGKKWLRRLTEEFVNETKLTSRKRPSSSTLSSYKKVGEIRDKNGSYRGKRLKRADVVSEPTSPLLSVFINNCENMHKSNSYPKETMKQGNALMSLGSQLAPPSLPSMAEFAHLSDSSVSQSSHLEQASSQNITPSAPVHQSPQLQASLLRTYGQPIPLPQGSLLGMQSHNPQITNRGTAAKRVEEATNTVPTIEDLADQKNGAYDVELGYNVTAGPRIMSEINTGNSVDPMMPPNNAGGSQHPVSQQGDGSAMDVRLPKSVLIEHVPFVETSEICETIGEMGIVSKAPRRPHFNQPQQHCPELCEGMRFGLMLSFASLEESINRLDGHEDDYEVQFEEKMQGLSLLEAYGFDVGALRSRLEAMFCIKNRHHAKLRDDDSMKALEEKISRKEADDRELGAQIRVLAMATHHLRLYARLMRGVMRSAVSKKMNNAMEISRLKQEANALEQLYLSTTVSWRDLVGTRL